MKKISIVLFTGMIIIFSGNIFAQSAGGSWSGGLLGLTYPRFEKTTVIPSNTNYGYHAFLQRNFSLNTAIRIKGSYLSMRGNIPAGLFRYTDGNPVPGNTEEMRTNLYVLDMDFIYKIFPLEFVSPYAGAGAGLTLIDPVYKSDIASAPSGSTIKPELNVFVGGEWGLKEKWNLVTEVGYHFSNGNLDGIEKAGGAKSFNDSYLTVSAGVKYCLTETNGLACCVRYKGLSASGKIPPLERGVWVKESTIKPVQVASEKTVNMYPFTNRGLGATVVKFKFNEASIQPDFRNELLQAVFTLKMKKNLELEIRGFTDNSGPSRYNKKLSEKRAQAVESYFISNGISPSRLSIKGFGEAMPVAGNKTRADRAENRRVELRIK